jgi:hypothetical protein
VTSIAKLPRAAKMALVGALLVVLAMVGKGFAGANDQPIGVSSAPLPSRSGAPARPRVTTTVPQSPNPNPAGRNPFQPAK